MTDQTNDQDNAQITDTGKPSARTVTPMRIFLGAAVITSLGAMAYLTLGRPTLGGNITLNDAFVHGAVSHIGTDDNARIMHLHVALGDTVAKGDPLIDLSDARLKARRKVLEARIDGIEAHLRATRHRHDLARQHDGKLVDAERLDRDAIAAQLEQARAQVTLIAERVDRNSELADSGYASKARLSTQATELDQARAEVSRLTARLGAANLSIDRARIDLGADLARTAERDGIAADLRQAQAELAELDLRINRRTLTALDTGVVVDVPARPGASVGTDDPILSIWDPAQTWMVAWVDQDRMDRIRVGDMASVEIDSVLESVAGQVQRILVASDGQEQTLPGQPVSPLLPDGSRFAVQISFDAREIQDRILPGMSGKVSITPTGENQDKSALASLRQFVAGYVPLWES